MTQLKYNDTLFTVSKGASVLETLLEHGQEIPNSCRAGACHTCLMQATNGKVPDTAQNGLKDSHKVKGFFLACVCKPDEDLEVCLPDVEKLKISATVSQITKLSEDVIELKVKPSEPIDYYAGQFVTLWRDDALGRNYSLASLPHTDEDLTFHIRLIKDGQFTGWVLNELKVGDKLSVQEPVGDCFYTQGNAEQNLLLVGTGTGLAPLFGIMNDAIRSGHTGDIHLFHGGLSSPGLYLHDMLTTLAKQHPNLYYHPCVLKADENMADNIIEGDLCQIVSQKIDKPVNWKSYLCGDPEIVKKLRKKIFMAGSKMTDIYSDPFVYT